MPVAHANGTAPNAATTDPLKVEFTLNGTKRLINGTFYIKNTDVANVLNVSFDNGNNYYPIATSGEMHLLNIVASYFYVTGTAGTATFCSIANVS